MQSKQTSWYNLSSKKKKKCERGDLRRQNISENLSFNRALNTIPFVAKHSEAKPQKPLLKSDKNFEDYNSSSKMYNNYLEK